MDFKSWEGWPDLTLSVFDPFSNGPCQKDLGNGIQLVSVLVKVNISQKVPFLIPSDCTVWKKLPSVNKNQFTIGLDVVLKT